MCNTRLTSVHGGLKYLAISGAAGIFSCGSGLLASCHANPGACTYRGCETGTGWTRLAWRANVSEDFGRRVLLPMNDEPVARVDNTFEMAASAMCPAFWLGPLNDAGADFGGLS